MSPQIANPRRSEAHGLRARAGVRAAWPFVLALALAGACRTAAPNPGENASPTASLRVDNESFADRVIYVMVDGGVRQRLGTARGEGTTKFVLPHTLLQGPMPLQFVAEPIGGFGSEVSDQIDVFPGDSVEMVIMGNQ